MRVVFIEACLSPGDSGASTDGFMQVGILLDRVAKSLAALPREPTTTWLRPLSPPLAFERAVGTASAIERIELRDVLVREPKVEHLGVLGDAFAVRRLRNRRDAVLDAPAQQHLRRRAMFASRDLRDRVAPEVATGSEWAVGLERDPVREALVEECSAVLVGAELHLIHHWWIRCRREQLTEVVDAE